jgi:hypothetical protein
MVRAKNASKKENRVNEDKQVRKVKLDGLLKLQLQRHAKWPNLKVNDWQPLAKGFWHL